jgi:hypothetical protein
VSNSTEEYFEGPAPSKSRRWIILLAVVLIVALLAMFARATLPGQRSEFVGMWKDIKKPQFYYDLRADGSFTAVTFEEWFGNNVHSQVMCKGTWKASPEALYLTYTSMEPGGTVKKPKEFARDAKERIGKELRFDVEWVAKNQWHLGWDASRTYQRAR